MMNDTELQKFWVLSNPLNFTRYFFSTRTRQANALLS